MISVHYDFRLNNRQQTCFLAKRSIAGQVMHICVDAACTWNSLSYSDGRSPVGETDAQVSIVNKPLPEVVQTERDLFTGKTCQSYCCDVGFNPWNDTGFFQKMDKRNALLRGLMKGVVVQHSAA